MGPCHGQILIETETDSSYIWITFIFAPDKEEREKLIRRISVLSGDGEEGARMRTESETSTLSTPTTPTTPDAAATQRQISLK